MLHIVAYDIRDKKRLQKISRLCLDYGLRVQYSIFEFDLSEKLTADFIREISAVADPEKDRIMIIPVCRECHKKIHYIGTAEPFCLPQVFLI